MKTENEIDSLELEREMDLFEFETLCRKSSLEQKREINLKYNKRNRRK